jgi:ATP-dependent Clp protease protease subunit
MTRHVETRSQAMQFLEREQGALLERDDKAQRELGYILPTVTEVTHRGEREWNIFSRLLKDRIVFIGTEIDDFVANAVIAQFLFLESEDPEKDI